MRALAILRRRFLSEIVLERLPDGRDLIYEKNGVRFYLSDVAEIRRIDEPITRLQEFLGEKCVVCDQLPVFEIRLKNGDFGFLCRFCGERLSEKLFLSIEGGAAEP